MLVYILLPIVLLVILTYLVLDYRGAKEISLQASEAFGMPCLRAGELIVQEFDQEGSLWASRGLILYRLKRGEDTFKRVAHVPAGLSYIWLNNFTLFRKFTNKPECIEASITRCAHLCVMSDGRMWHRSGLRGKFQETLRLRHFGLGVGRGILSNGLLSLADGTMYFGEYFRNPGRKEEVRIYKSPDNGQTWSVVHTFEPGATRHVHALQEDPFTGRLWVCTGDYDQEAMIAWSDNGYVDIHPIGSGSQMWRTTQLVFTEDAVYWGSDSGSVELAGVYRWDRKSRKVDRVHETAGGILFGTRLQGGTLVFSTDREGFENERDKLTRLILLNGEGRTVEIECGTWKHWKKGLRYSFAMLRSQRNQGQHVHAISVINQKEFPAGELLLLEEDVLLSYWDSKAPRSGASPR